MIIALQEDRSLGACPCTCTCPCLRCICGSQGSPCMHASSLRRRPRGYSLWVLQPQAPVIQQLPVHSQRLIAFCRAPESAGTTWWHLVPLSRCHAAREHKGRPVPRDNEPEKAHASRPLKTIFHDIIICSFVFAGAGRGLEDRPPRSRFAQCAAALRQPCFCTESACPAGYAVMINSPSISSLSAACGGCRRGDVAPCLMLAVLAARCSSKTILSSNVVVQDRTGDLSRVRRM